MHTHRLFIVLAPWKSWLDDISLSSPWGGGKVGSVREFFPGCMLLPDCFLDLSRRDTGRSTCYIIVVREEYPTRTIAVQSVRPLILGWSHDFAAPKCSCRNNMRSRQHLACYYPFSRVRPVFVLTTRKQEPYTNHESNSVSACFIPRFGM